MNARLLALALVLLFAAPVQAREERLEVELLFLRGYHRWHAKQQAEQSLVFLLQYLRAAPQGAHADEARELALAVARSTSSPKTLAIVEQEIERLKAREGASEKSAPRRVKLPDVAPGSRPPVELGELEKALTKQGRFLAAGRSHSRGLHANNLHAVAGSIPMYRKQQQELEEKLRIRSRFPDDDQTRHLRKELAQTRLRIASLDTVKSIGVSSIYLCDCLRFDQLFVDLAHLERHELQRLLHEFRRMRLEIRDRAQRKPALESEIAEAVRIDKRLGDLEHALQANQIPEAQAICDELWAWVQTD